MFKTKLKILISVSWVLKSVFSSKREGQIPYENIWKIPNPSLGEVGRQNWPEGGRPTWSRLPDLCSGPFDLIFWRWVLIGSKSMPAKFFPFGTWVRHATLPRSLDPLFLPNALNCDVIHSYALCHSKFNAERSFWLSLTFWQKSTYTLFKKHIWKQKGLYIWWNSPWAELYLFN